MRSKEKLLADCTVCVESFVQKLEDEEYRSRFKDKLLDDIQKYENTVDIKRDAYLEDCHMLEMIVLTEMLLKSKSK